MTVLMEGLENEIARRKKEEKKRNIKERQSNLQCPCEKLPKLNWG